MARGLALRTMWALLSLVVALVSCVGAAGGREPRALGSGSYTLLNTVLGGLRVPVDLSKVAQIEADTGVLGVKLIIKFPADKPAVCTKVNVGDIGISSARKADLEGLQRLDVRLALSKVQVQCDVPVCIKTTLPANDFDCGGVARLISNAASGSSVAIEQILLSRDFDAALPSQSRASGRSCADTVNIDGILFEGTNLKSIVGIDITGAIVGALNGGSKQLALVPVRQAICDALVGLETSLRQVTLRNPLTELLNVTAPQPDATRLERALASRVGAAGLVDLADNPLTKLVLPTRTGAGGRKELVLDPQNGVVKAAVQALGLGGTGNSSGSLLGGIFEAVLGQPLPAASGSSVDLIAAAAKLLGLGSSQAVLDKLQLSAALDGAGKFEARVGAARLVAASGVNLDGATVFPFLGAQTLGSPLLGLGAVRLELSMRLSADVNAKLLEGVTPIKFALTENLVVTASAADLALRAAALLAVETGKLARLELGGALRSPADCLKSAFSVAPRLSELELLAKQLDLRVAGCVDGIGCALQDLVNNALVPLAIGKVPSALDAILGGQVEDKALVGDASCPSVRGQGPADLSRGPLASLSAQLDTALANRLISGLGPSLGGGAGGGKGPGARLDVLGALSVQFDLPQIGGLAPQRLALALDSVTLGVGDVSDLTVLAARNASDVRQLANRLAVSGLFVAASLQVNSSALPGQQQPPAQSAAALIAPGQSNRFSVNVSVDAIDVAARLFAYYSNATFEGVTLREATSLDCWTGKLEEQGSGLRSGSLRFALPGLAANLDCERCDSPLMQQFAASFASAQARAQLGSAMAQLERSLRTTEAAFAPDRFQGTVEAARAACAAATVARGAQALPGASAAGSIQLVGGLGLLAAAAGAVAFGGPAMRRRWRLHKTAPHRASASPPAWPSSSSSSSVSVSVSSSNPRRAPPVARPKQLALQPTDKEQSSQARGGREPQESALCGHPLVGPRLRVAVPFMLALDLALFVFGHTAAVINIVANGSLLGGPFSLGRDGQLADFSVITSTRELFKSGATALAVLIAIFSIAWPYVKLVLMTVCWFAPPRLLRAPRRKTLLDAIDRAGKWSLIELYVVSFIILVLDIKLDGPDQTIALFPPGLYSARISVLPQSTLFAFITALLLSLLVCSVMANVEERVEDERLQASGGCVEDLAPLFRAVPGRARTCCARLPERALALLSVGGAVLALILVIVAAVVDVLRIELLGILARAVALGGQETDTRLSLVDFIARAFASDAAGAWFFALALASTALVIPLAYLGLCAWVIAQPRLTLQRAMRLRRLLHLVAAWSALEVFVLATAVSTVELGTLTKNLLADQCAGVAAFASTTLLPLGLVSQRDAQAGCFALEATVLPGGATAFLIALFASNAVHYLVSVALAVYMEKRAACPGCPPQASKQLSLSV